IVGGRAYASRLEADARERLRDEAATLAAAIDDFVASRRHAIEELALMLDVDRGQGPRQPDRVLGDYELAYEDFITILAADATGPVVAAGRRGQAGAAVAAHSVAGRDYFAATLKDGHAHVSGVFRDRSFGIEPIVAIAAPRRDARGRITGIVEGSFDPRKL